MNSASRPLTAQEARGSWERGFSGNGDDDIASDLGAHHRVVKSACRGGRARDHGRSRRVHPVLVWHDWVGTSWDRPAPQPGDVVQQHSTLETKPQDVPARGTGGIRRHVLEVLRQPLDNGIA